MPHQGKRGKEEKKGGGSEDEEVEEQRVEGRGGAGGEGH